MNLAISGLAASYRKGQQVIHDINLVIQPGEFILILGHNGAGKTTLLNTIYGFHPPSRGTVSLGGEELGVGTQGRVRKGLAFVPSENAIFPGLTVQENLVAAATVSGAADRRSWRVAVKDALEWFPDIADKIDARAGSLSGGQRRMVAIAMALTQRPQYLLMDEPSLGLAPPIVDSVFERMDDLRKSLGLATLVVEQTARPTVLAADAIHVIRGGEQVFSGGREEFDRHDLWELL